MKKIKLNLIILLASIFMVTPSYATNLEPENEILSETKLEETEEATTKEKSGSHKLKISFKTKFQDETLMDKIKAIEITIPNGVSDSEDAGHDEEFILLKEEGFEKEVDLTVYSDLALIRARVFNDTAYRYDIEFEGREKLVYYGEEIRNATEINLLETNEVELTLIVLRQGEQIINNSNLVTETPELFKKVDSGQYGESREQEIKKTESSKETTKETTKAPKEEKPTIAESPAFGIVFVIVAVIVIIGGSALFIIRKRINEDDD